MSGLHPQSPPSDAPNRWESAVIVREEPEEEEEEDEDDGRDSDGDDNGDGYSE